MDVVDLRIFSIKLCCAFKAGINLRLKSCNCKLFDIGFQKYVLLFAFEFIGKTKAGRRSLYCSLKLCGSGNFAHTAAKLISKIQNQASYIAVKNYAVNRLKGQTAVINIYNFNKGIANRTVTQSCLISSIRDQLFFILIPHSLSGCEGVISISHCKEECRAVCGAVFLCDFFYSLSHVLKLIRTFYSPARNEAALAHKLAVVQRSFTADKLACSAHQ